MKISLDRKGNSSLMKLIRGNTSIIFQQIACSEAVPLFISKYMLNKKTMCILNILELMLLLIYGSRIIGKVVF